MAFTAEYIYRIKDKYSRSIDNISRKTDRFKMSVASTSMALKGLNKNLKTMGRSAKSFGRDMMTKVTLPIVAVGTAGVISFARIEKGLINVNNLLSRPDLEKFRGRLDNLHTSAIKAGFSIEDTNKGLFDTVSALGANESAFNTFGIAQKLAIGGATSLGVAVDGITSIMKAYEDQNLNATEVANAFFSAQVKGKTTVEQLANGIGNVAPMAKLAGVGFKELLATVSTLTLGGISTDESVTALNGALNALVNPQDDAAKAMKRMGISFGAANVKALGLKKILEQIAVAREKFGEGALTTVMPERRALKAIATLAAGGKLKTIDEILKKINSDLKTGDGLMRAFADQNSSMSLKFAKATGEMTIMFKSFVVLFAPTIKKMADYVALLANKLSKLSPQTKKIIGVLALLGAVLPPLITGLGMMAIAAGAISLPFLAITFAVAGVSAAIVSLIANWENLKGAFQGPGLMKDLIGWGAEKLGVNYMAESMGYGAANEKSKSRAAQNNKTEISGKIDVTASGGAKIKSANIGLNTGTNLAGAGA